VLGQLIPASLAVGLVLGGVDAACFLEDLGGDPLTLTRCRRPPRPAKEPLDYFEEEG
jgi:hypothetical protein